MVASGHVDESEDSLVDWCATPGTWGNTFLQIPTITFAEGDAPALKEVITKPLTAVTSGKMFKDGNTLSRWTQEKWLLYSVVTPVVLSAKTRTERFGALDITSLELEVVPIPWITDKTEMIQVAHNLFRGNHAPLVMGLNVGAFVTNWVNFCGLTIMLFDYRA